MTYPGFHHCGRCGAVYDTRGAHDSETCLRGHMEDEMDDSAEKYW